MFICICIHLNHTRYECESTRLQLPMHLPFQSFHRNVPSGAKKHRGKLGSSGLFGAGFAPPIAATSCRPAASKRHKKARQSCQNTHTNVHD